MCDTEAAATRSPGFDSVAAGPTLAADQSVLETRNKCELKDQEKYSEEEIAIYEAGGKEPDEGSNFNKFDTKGYTESEIKMKQDATIAAAEIITMILDRVACATSSELVEDNMKPE